MGKRFFRGGEGCKMARKFVQRRGTVRPLKVRISEIEDRLEKLKLQDMIAELREKARRKKRR